MLKNTTRLVILLLCCKLIAGCSGESTGKAPAVIIPSPFTGTWVSEDSDSETAFKLNIVQKADSVIGNYCLVRKGGRDCDCFFPSTERSFAFTHPANAATSLETWLVPYHNNRAPAGRLHLSLDDEKLIWQISELLHGNDFLIKQTTFYRDSTFH